ncbi:protein MCM10 homolog [Pieris brassicae]|uniref:protein MCM10 homolog n=1 Tax=Pieris brassicae TaxID=7116 RepID=UPI001E6627D3|nr:protein MCM10 homolog [Pieris brassicae]
METNDELAQLEQLLCADFTEDNSTKGKERSVQDVDIFTTPHTDDYLPPGTSNSISAVHNGDTDSSDDEERKNYTERKYSNYGTLVKKSLDQKDHELVDKRLEFESRLRDTNRDLKISKTTAKKSTQNIAHAEKHIFSAPESKIKTPADILTDPVFGIRVTKPIISSTALLDRMQGREAVNVLRVKRYVENEDLSKDWVIAGVIIKKSSSKKSQKGNQFIIWTLSDLKDDIKTVSIFLFRKAYNDLWKTLEGTVVAILNPNVLDRSENSKDQACLSVDNSDRVMILGQSKDLGICKSKKKNGEPCSAIVNMSQGEHCIYHIKQEYQKYSRRQELQSSTMGKGLVNIQNKVFGKNTFMYGGKAYSALPSGNNKVVKERDQNRLMSLSDYYKSEGNKLMTNKSPCQANIFQNKSGLLHSPKPQKISDTQRLNALSQNTLHESSLAEKVANSSSLGKGFSLNGGGTIDLNMSYSIKRAEKAKLHAVRLIQQNGGIEKINPNNIKGTEIGKKRAIEKLLTETDFDENFSKKTKCNDGGVKPKINIISGNEYANSNKKPMSERFKKILEATSAHVNLIKQHEDEEQDKYFNKLEKKEAMEEKMLNTFKIACKAVRCVKCKYTAFSAAELCKTERHPIKVIDTFKRFFKCADCNNRTIAFEVLPLHSCSNCRGSRWLKAPMIREKKEVIGETLSIRGEEEGFIGAVVTEGKNVNLLVPDS